MVPLDKTCFAGVNDCYCCVPIINESWSAVLTVCLAIVWENAGLVVASDESVFWFERIASWIGVVVKHLVADVHINLPVSLLILLCLVVRSILVVQGFPFLGHDRLPRQHTATA